MSRICGYSTEESGTEPVIRVMVEAGTHDECEAYVDEVIEVIKSKGYVAG